MNTQRLLQLAAFLRKLPPERFDFGSVVIHETKCGTIGCAMGWTPAVFPELVEWTKGWDEDSCSYPLTMVNGMDINYDDAAELIFEMDSDDAEFLFTPNEQEFIGLENCSSAATPSQVADLIEQYVDRASATPTQ